MSVRQKIKPKLREQVIQRDGLYCRHCGHGPMGVRWGCNQKGHVKLYNDWNQLGDEVIELDHLVPLARGGSNSAENLVVSCGSCNGRKWSKPVFTVLREPVPFTLLPRPRAQDLGWRPLSFRGFP